MPQSKTPRLRILSVGGNAVSAFLSWRLQATNACDVTLVWKSGFESVAQYGISFRSSRFGNERFKPRLVVRSPEEAAGSMKGSFDYVLLCIKALPDVYDMASIIESVVTPQHTCILINTSSSIGVESMVEERFPKNVVLSIVSNSDISQLGPSEFEHKGATDLWVGPANVNPEIPSSIQSDMAEALAMTLGSGQVECKVSKNIQQQQFERMIGPIAFHTTSVLFETPNHADLLQLTGVRDLIYDTMEEVIKIAQARGCTFDSDLKEKVIEEMIAPKDANSVMFQDYAAKRPMEIETFLGSPLKLAQSLGIKIPRIETLYAMLHHVNIANQKRASAAADATAPTPSGAPPPMPRMSSAPMPRSSGPNGSVPPGAMRPSMMNGPPPGMPGRGNRAPSMTGPPPQMRRAMSGMNGHPPHMNGMPPRGPQRRPSFENGNALDEFSHLVMYDSPDGTGEVQNGEYAAVNGNGLALRERELMIRQKELALREREMGLRNGRGPVPRPPPSHAGGFDDDEEGEDDFFDPMAYRGPPVDPDNVDMMSITSRRNRKQSSQGQLRGNPVMGGPGSRRSNAFGRPGANRNRTSSHQMMQDIPNLHDSIMDNPMMGYSSDRFGGFDRKALGQESRNNSLTAARLNEMGGPYGGFPPMARRTSQSPGNPFSPGARAPPPHAPSHGYPQSPVDGRPSPPDMRQPVPRHPPGHGNVVAPQEVEQRAGVSNLYPSKNPQVRSLTGSASASAGSGDSGRSHNIESENSAYSSQSSLGPRPPIGVR